MAESTVTHLILGDGAAGMVAAQTLRALAPDESLLIVSSDPRPYYYRAALTNYLLGRLGEKELDALPRERQEALDLRRVEDTLVELRPQDHRARLARSGWVTYRRVLIATGASARRLAPPSAENPHGVAGADLAGITVLRTLADANEVIERAERARHAVVVGGGILGLEAAQALTEAGLSVALVHRNATLMERVLDRTAADLVAQRVRRSGVDLRLTAEVESFQGGRHGVSEVRLKDGARLPADLVVLALGNVPNTAPWIQGTGVATENAYIRVDRRMRATRADDPAQPCPDVYAAGDVAHVHDASLPFANPAGLWQPAVKQGIVAARNMVVGDGAGSGGAAEYRPGAILNATRAWDLDLTTLGDHVERPNGADAETRSVRYERRQDDPPVYKHVLLRGGRVVGALLLGDRREATALQTLMNLRGAAGDVSTIQDELLRPEFDLFSWVDAQRQAPGVGRWDQQVDAPQGARPRGLTQVRRPLTQRSLGQGDVRAKQGRTALLTSAPPPPLALTLDGRALAISGDRIELGGVPEADVRLSDPGVAASRFVIERQGMLWMARAQAHAPVALLKNGRLVAGFAPLRSGDVLDFGAHRVGVALGLAAHGRGPGLPPAPPAQPAPASPARSAGPAAFLLGSRTRHELVPPAVRLGRDPSCDVVIEHVSVSRHHADLRFDAAARAWVLSPLSPDLPVHVNGEALVGPRRLAAQDKIALGRMSLTFGLAAPPRQPAERAREAKTQSARVPGWLVALRGPLVGQALPLSGGTTLGRGDAASLRLDDVLLSGLHARFSSDASGALDVVDLASTNGTRVNGQRLEPDVPRALADGDRLEAGRHEFRFCVKAPEAAIFEAASQERQHVAQPTLAAGRASWRLEQAQEGAPAATFPLVDDLVRVGRAPHADLHLPSADVSREHAELRASAAGIEVVDLASRAGTRVNGRALLPRVAQPLSDGDVLAFASRTFTLRRSETSPQEARSRVGPRVRASLVPLRQRLGLGPLPLQGNGPWIVGRQASMCALVVPEETVSRTHCEVARQGEGFTVRNLSSSGTTLNGEPVPDGQALALSDGDVLMLQDVPLRLRLERTGSAALPSPAERFRGSAALATRTPLENDLESVVERELAACIGCHECLHACPLEGAARVSIGALNAYARDASAGTPDVLAFVDDCTQCQRCVPVCPADIRRSRLVLWNKLRSVPKDERRLTLEAGESQTTSSLTVGAVAHELKVHEVFGTLSDADLKRLVSGARLRQLEPGETLLREGQFLDALWLIWEGSLSSDVEVAEGASAITIPPVRGQNRSLVTYGPGQTVGEAALLGDQPADATLTARKRCLVLGFTKYALTSLRERQGAEAFDAALEALYLGRSRHHLLSRLGLSEEAARAFAAELEPRRYAAGQPILSRLEAADAFGWVSRGFVRERRRGLGRPRVANYLKPGDVFGGPDVEDGDDVLLSYEAATQADAFLLTREKLAALDRRFPGIQARLLPEHGPRAGAAQRRADDEGTFACPGGLGPLQASALLVIDTRLCVDCNNCVDACERRHGRPRLERENAGLQQGPFQVPASCYHCVDPLCLFCSVNGIVRDPSGEIRIVEDNCIGCGQCAERCPYDNIFMVPRSEDAPGLWQSWVAEPLRRVFGRRGARWDVPQEVEQVAVKCDLCADHADGPACVRSCPTGAARRDDPLTLFGVGRGERHG